MRWLFLGEAALYGALGSTVGCFLGIFLARALVRDPDLLLLDEPFAALDALTRLAMHRLVLDLWRTHRPSVLLVTHDVDEALRLASRVLVLSGGRIVSEHTPGDRATVLADLGVSENATA